MRIVPTYEQPVSRKDVTQSVWYRFFQDLHKGVAPSNEMTITVGASPFTYTAASGGSVLLTGGTVSAVQLTRSVTTLTGQTAGMFQLDAGDQLTVTYSGLPTMVFYPR